MPIHSRPFIVPLLCLAASACASNPVASSSTPGQVADWSRSASSTSSDMRLSQPPQSSDSVQDSHGFDAWIADFRRRARARGVAADVLDDAFDAAEFQPRIVELDRRQPEFSRAIWSYLDSAVSDARISQGRGKLAGHDAIGRAVEQRYGVPRTIIGAIWGVESNYGSNFGSFETIDALATLGYDGRRTRFAEEQLYAALEILKNGDIDRDRMRGSWAGAMGHTQFIPTSFNAYAVDEDGDGRRDIWGSIADVMGSTANYLKSNGWQRGSTWGREVVLPPNFDYAQAELDTRRSTATWRSAGVRAVDSRGLPSYESASIIAPAGAHGPAFLVGPNFRVILRYNNATSYALAVGLLSDRLAGQPGVFGDWPRTLASLSHTEIKDMQRALNDLGYGTGTPDGIMGPNTRSGLRAFQRANGMTADGYPTHDLLRQIRATAG